MSIQHQAVVGVCDGVGARFVGSRPEDAAADDFESARRQHVVDPQIAEVAEVRRVLGGIALPDRIRVVLCFGGELRAALAGVKSLFTRGLFRSCCIVPGTPSPSTGSQLRSPRITNCSFGFESAASARVVDQIVLRDRD